MALKQRTTVSSCYDQGRGQTKTMALTECFTHAQLFDPKPNFTMRCDCLLFRRGCVSWLLSDEGHGEVALMTTLVSDLLIDWTRIVGCWFPRISAVSSDNKPRLTDVKLHQQTSWLPTYSTVKPHRFIVLEVSNRDAFPLFLLFHVSYLCWLGSIYSRPSSSCVSCSLD